MIERPFSFLNEEMQSVYVHHWAPEELAGEIADDKEEFTEELVDAEELTEKHTASLPNHPAGNLPDSPDSATKRSTRFSAEPSVLESRNDGLMAAPPAPKAVIQIVHGMAETGKRYGETAAALVAQGYLVYAPDLRGHGFTADRSEGLGYAGKDGHNGMVQDILTLGTEIRRRHPGLPVFLLGHSMGSFLVQKVMYTGPELYEGFLLTGSCGRQSFLSFGQKAAELQCRLQGERHPSVLLNALVFGPYNRQFRPIRTPFDWLTRDTGEVDRFVADPYCGQLSSAGFFCDFFRLLREIHLPANMANIPVDKPVFVFSGDRDPVGHNGKGVQRLIADYDRLGLRSVDWKLYPGARHELFHELNKEEVVQDVINWLDQKVRQPVNT